MYVFVISIIVDACVAKDRQRETAAAGEEKRRGEAGGEAADLGWRVRAVSAGDGERRLLWVSQTRVVARRGSRRERKKSGFRS